MILDTIQERIEIKRVGSRYLGRCPFHDEKTPSFYVFPDTEKYHCFGCGAHGDEIDFIKNYHQVEFPEALKILGISKDYKPNPLKKKRNFKLDRILFDVVWEMCSQDEAKILELSQEHHDHNVRWYAERFNRAWDKQTAWYEMVKEFTHTILCVASDDTVHSRTLTNQELQQLWDYFTLLDKEYNCRTVEAESYKEITTTLLKNA